MKIRLLQKEDVLFFAKNPFPWSNQEDTFKKWARYFEEQAKGIRLSFIIEAEGEMVGYGHLLLHSDYSPFMNSQIPEIHDVWVFENHRNKGFGTSLLSHLEQVAKKRGFSKIGMGVGLYKDYGSAQKLYYQLDYKPDGNGITYKYKQVIPGQMYPVDDDLLLWLTKTL